MKFKVAFRVVQNQTFEVEAESGDAIEKHWREHELRKVPDCQCPITLLNLLESQMTEWTILDLHPITRA